MTLLFLSSGSSSENASCPAFLNCSLALSIGGSRHSRIAFLSRLTKRRSWPSRPALYFSSSILSRFARYASGLPSAPPAKFGPSFSRCSPSSSCFVGLRYALLSRVKSGALSAIVSPFRPDGSRRSAQSRVYALTRFGRPPSPIALARAAAIGLSFLPMSFASTSGVCRPVHSSWYVSSSHTLV